MNLLLTGATGFLGSHLALRWLLRDDAARVGCVVRAPDAASASLRLRAALCQAAADAGIAADGVLERADALPGELGDGAWVGQAERWMQGPAELIHCAASLSFREADRPAVWQTNVDGTAAVLAALPRLPGIAGFNYVSTAYVAGNRGGDILEGERDRPASFNNPYEHSKWTAEGLVRAACDACGTPWRILRPSIVIGHSRTHRLSSQSGFYQVVETLLRFGHQARRVAEPILLPMAPGSRLDLIPVDTVVDEVIALVAAGERTANRTFHIVAEDPLGLADVLRELTPMSGVPITLDGPDTPLSPAARLVMHRLRYYLPYFATSRRFDRSNVRAALGAVAFRIDVEQLRAFVQSYLAQRGHEPGLAA